MDPVWDWAGGDINDNFDEASFLEMLGNNAEEGMANPVATELNVDDQVHQLIPGPQMNGQPSIGRIPVITKQPKAPKKRMLEISASASLKVKFY